LYWLVDHLMEEGYRVHLANPSKIQQYSGLKHGDDEYDSFWLAEMLRLQILPEDSFIRKSKDSTRRSEKARAFSKVEDIAHGESSKYPGKEHRCKDEDESYQSIERGSGDTAIGK